jgi:hypothetical protein
MAADKEMIAAPKGAESQGADPLYEHDCEGCRYLGKYHTEGTRYDLYYCGTHEKSFNNTVIGRYGNDGPEYCSGMSFADLGHEPYAEARRRAISLGYYNPVEMPLLAPSREVKDIVVMIDHFIRAMAKSIHISTQPGQDLALREMDRLIAQYSEEDDGPTLSALKAFKEYLEAEWRGDELEFIG